MTLIFIKLNVRVPVHASVDFWLQLPECAPFSCQFDSGSCRIRLGSKVQRQSWSSAVSTCFNRQLLRQATGVGRCDKTRWRSSPSGTRIRTRYFLSCRARRRATYLYAANKYRVIRIFRCQCAHCERRRMTAVFLSSAILLGEFSKVSPRNVRLRDTQP